MRKINRVIWLLSCLLVFSCQNPKTSNSGKKANEKLTVVTTTTMITDLLQEVGGDKINVNGLMGSGVDPHLYKASEGDVNKLFNADIVFYNGLHLEGKLEDVFEKMKHQQKKTYAVSTVLDRGELIASENFASSYDPHIWFDIASWKKATNTVVVQLSKIDSKNTRYYNQRGQDYLARLEALQEEIGISVASLPKEKRILVTAHDAFNYFGKAFDFEVVGLQGLSTATEAGVQDVQKMAKFIIDRKVNAIFVESSVPMRTIEALKASVKSKGHEVSIGGTLYSDALGTPGTLEGTYIGMYRHNVKTIVAALR